MKKQVIDGIEVLQGSGHVYETLSRTDIPVVDFPPDEFEDELRVASR